MAKTRSIPDGGKIDQGSHAKGHYTITIVKTDNPTTAGAAMLGKDHGILGITMLGTRLLRTRSSETEFGTTKLKNWEHVKAQELTGHMDNSLVSSWWVHWVHLDVRFYFFHSSACETCSSNSDPVSWSQRPGLFLLSTWKKKTCFSPHSDWLLNPFQTELRACRSKTVPGQGQPLAGNWSANNPSPLPPRL